MEVIHVSCVIERGETHVDYPNTTIVNIVRQHTFCQIIDQLFGGLVFVVDYGNMRPSDLL